jgi:hypothetical protein
LYNLNYNPDYIMYKLKQISHQSLGVELPTRA